jgi:hypothetical protein
MKLIVAMSTEFVLLSPTCSAEGTDSQCVTIPLDRIWALEMPGSRDIRQLEPEVFGKSVNELPVQVREQRISDSLINKITSVLEREPGVEHIQPEKAIPRNGFAVEGNGKDALRAAYDVLAEKGEPQKSFSPNGDITLVFFTYPAGCLIELHQVDHRNKLIQLRYRFVSTGLSMSTEQLTLIPLGRLSAGEYRVEMIQTPMRGKFISAGEGQIRPDWEKRIICRPLSFSVTAGE